MIDHITTPRGAIRGGSAALAIAWVLAAGTAHAADEARPADEDKDLVTVTATRIPQPVADVPATVTVITADTIADQLASDVKDLVRFEPGVSVRRAPARFGAAQGVTGRDGNAGFNIRGLEGNRVLIQVDGVRVPDGFEFGAQSAGRGDYVDLGVIKSVEILRGPASALYGSDGLAGAVSFVTSDPQDFLTGGKSFGGIARAGFDSADDQFSETGIVAGAIGNWSAMLAYTGRDGQELDNKGTNTSPNANRTAPNPQDTNSNAVLAKLVWTPDGHNRLRLTYDHLDGHVRTNVLSGISNAPTIPATGVIGLTASDHTRRNRVSVDWRYTGTGAIASAQLTAWYQDGENRQFTAEDRNTAADRTRLNTFENRVYGASVEVRSDFSTGSLTHKLVYGGDASFTRQKGLRDGTVPTPPDVFPTRAFPVTDYTLAGAWLADEIGIGGGVVTLHPALRFDHYSLDPQNDPLLPAFAAAEQSDSRISPKLGLVVRPVEGVRLFANYARGFKAPSPTQVNQFFQNLSQGYTSIPNPNLRPETSETWEGGVKLGTGPINADVTGFTGRYKDFISQEVVSGGFTPANPAVFQFINLNRVKIEGVEGKLEARSGGFSGRLAASYAKGTVTGTGGAKSPLSTIDPVKLVGGIGYDASDRRFGGQIVATHSAQKPKSATTYVGTSGPASICTGVGGCFRPGGFTIVDATAYVRVAKVLTLRAGIFNIFDRKYAWWSDVRGLAASSAVTDAYTQPGRNASVSLTAKF
ncbi:MAG: TonB-dependent hemoglobin/transferrin/lactoferrin family receptor [Sphingomonas sp.]|jgi:hemoglobin/transferrin/lactoferrin receptor protein|uniref:TonB-dependent hemoglobin/transferrin/lactoferrin family receptor n=1 Tax=Sphingomonas sp. TaxID=28214 RepID=UPI0035628920